MLRVVTFVVVLFSRCSQFDSQKVADVTKFGAVGDGKTDDLAAINSAINSIQNTGGMVYFPSPGQYAISKPIILADINSITLSGGGKHVASCTTRGASILSLTENSTLVVLDRCGHCNVENLLLAHVELTNSSSNRTILRPMNRDRQDRSLRVTKSNVFQSVHRVIPNTGVAIVVRDSYECILERLWIEGVYQAIDMRELANTLTIGGIFLQELFSYTCRCFYSCQT